MRRRHAMPFGAEVLSGGGVRFRLWAPGARTVALSLEDGPELAMVPLDGGWFELRTGRAAAGALYRYRIDGSTLVPDPASRSNPMDVHGPSRVVDPLAFAWRDDAWTGRPWEEAVIYELHVGTFTAQGGFAGVMGKLPHLAALGVTAVELMPVADFPRARNWGYDGVLPFAPEGGYGAPEDLKSLVQAAHGLGMMVLLDVVYNHFGPEGNYLHLYAPDFFSRHHATPWGDGIGFDAPRGEVVRDFFRHNALYWLEEFHVDGLRLDAVHAIADDSTPGFLRELAQAVRDGPGKTRQVHLVLENDRNEARYLRPGADGTARYTAQWNDDAHHALHVLLTGETDRYYADYAAAPARHLGRALAEGFAYQGEDSAYRGGHPRGEASGDLPATAFVNFLQTHDQVGNRALSERLAALAPPGALRTAVAVLLLAPSVPLLFMGEEWGARQPFLYFCDFEPPLGAAVSAGRRKEFPLPAQSHADIPDPADEAAWLASRLEWGDAALASGRAWQAWYRDLLALRRREIVPRLRGLEGGGRFEVVGRALVVRWVLGDGAVLSLRANLDDAPGADLPIPGGGVLFAYPPEAARAGALPPWSLAWFLDARDRAP